MSSWIVWLVAAGGVTTSVVLWFRDAKRIMRNRKSTVDSAKGQLVTCRKWINSTNADPDAAAVLERSEKIYRQAVELYNQTIRKPWVLVPALIMGYHVIK